MRISLQGAGQPQRLTPKTKRPSKALKGLAVHNCTYKDCGKTYTRKEHLLRHERTHRNELPYVCVDCNQAYARQDLLKRHTALKHAFSSLVTSRLARTVPHQADHGNAQDSQGSLTHQGYRQGDNHLDYRPLEPGNQRLVPRTNGVTTQQSGAAYQGYLPNGYGAQQKPPGYASTALTHHSSGVRLDLSGLPQLQTSPGRIRGSRYADDQVSQTALAKQLPVPWGAPIFQGPQQEANIDILRESSYGNLAAVRRKHLAGFDVLASGQFHNGGPKSGLFAAAESIQICFEDISRSCPQPGIAQDRIWQDINARVEVVKYLTYHGASINSLHPSYQENVQRALQGQPPVAPRPSSQQANGYPPIASADPGITLRPMMPDSEMQDPSPDTGPLEVVQVGP